MDELVMIALLLCIILISFTLLRSLLPFQKTATPQKLPPGPTPLPIIGNIHNLGNQPHKSLALLAQTYGPIMYLQLGRINTIVISSSQTAQQVLQKQDLAFSSRSVPHALHACDQYKYSVIWFPVGSKWRSLRRIMSSNIFSGNRLNANQHLRSNKVDDLIRYCRKCSQIGEAVDIGRAAFTTSLNLLSNTVFSMDMTDPQQDSAKEFKDLVWNIMVEAGKPNLVDFFPVLDKIDPQGIKKRMAGHFEKLIKMFDGLITERLELRRLRTSDENTDVLDELIKISEDTGEIDKTHMERMFVDLFAAGTDTTSSTVEWGMAEVLKNSEILQKVKVELDQAIGKGKMVKEADISELPYLRCVVKETTRLHPPVPFLIPRRVEEEVELCGYTIPKGSQVLVNAWAIGRDPLLWKNPLAFKPERFMESEVDVKGGHFELIPFGAGRRICPGLPLAMRMVPVMLGSLINCFDWEVEGGIAPEEMDMEEKFGITLAKLHPFRAMATPVVN